MKKVSKKWKPHYDHNRVAQGSWFCRFDWASGLADPVTNKVGRILCDACSIYNSKHGGTHPKTMEAKLETVEYHDCCAAHTMRCKMWDGVSRYHEPTKPSLVSTDIRAGIAGMSAKASQSKMVQFKTVWKLLSNDRPMTECVSINFTVWLSCICLI